LSEDRERVCGLLELSRGTIVCMRGFSGMSLFKGTSVVIHK